MGVADVTGKGVSDETGLRSPLLFGLKGAESSWRMWWLSQKRENSPRNCGQPSLLIDDGQPKRLNQVVRTAMTEVDDKE